MGDASFWFSCNIEYGIVMLGLHATPFAIQSDWSQEFKSDIDEMGKSERILIGERLKPKPKAECQPKIPESLEMGFGEKKSERL